MDIEHRIGQLLYTTAPVSSFYNKIQLRQQLVTCTQMTPPGQLEMTQVRFLAIDRFLCGRFVDWLVDWLVELVALLTGCKAGVLGG